MKRYAVFGNPIAHSQSPWIHTRFARQTGQNLEYRAQAVDPGCFAEAADNFFAEGGSGLNITMPFKQDAFNKAAVLSSRAKRAGAVNTLSLSAEGVIHGDNTDGFGLVTDLLELHNWQIDRQRVLILGAGGAVRGVLQPLLDQRPAAVCVANRTVSKAEDLIAEFCVSEQLDITAASLGQLNEASSDAFDLILNATSASVSGRNIEVPRHLIHADTRAYDMMYGAEPTTFCQWAIEQGMTAVDGLGMLVCQAAESFRIWRGVTPQIAPVVAELRARLSKPAT